MPKMRQIPAVRSKAQLKIPIVANTDHYTEHKVQGRFTMVRYQEGMSGGSL